MVLIDRMGRKLLINSIKYENAVWHAEGFSFHRRYDDIAPSSLGNGMASTTARRRKVWPYSCRRDNLMCLELCTLLEIIAENRNNKGVTASRRCFRMFPFIIHQTHCRANQWHTRTRRAAEVATCLTHPLTPRHVVGPAIFGQ